MYPDHNPSVDPTNAAEPSAPPSAENVQAGVPTPIDNVAAQQNEAPSEPESPEDSATGGESND